MSRFRKPSGPGPVFGLIFLLVFLGPLLFSFMGDILIGIATLLGIGFTLMLAVGVPASIIAAIVKTFKTIKKEKERKKKEEPVIEYYEEEPEEYEFEEPVTAQPKPKPAPVPVPEIDYIKSFAQLDSEIEHSEISEELVKAQKYLTQLKKLEEEYPEVKEKTKRLYTYYLPMLEKILKEYSRISAVNMTETDLEEYRTKIVQTLKIINEAMSSIGAELYMKYHDVINADMDVLESLLRKDGLVEDMKLTAGGKQ